MSATDFLKSETVKSSVVIIGALCAATLGFITFGDRIVARAETRTAEGVEDVRVALKQHVEDSRVVHTEIRDVMRELTTEMKEFRSDVKALYRAMPTKRMQSRLEVDVVEPNEEGFGAPPFPTVGMPVSRRDGGR